MTSALAVGFVVNSNQLVLDLDAGPLVIAGVGVEGHLPFTVGAVLVLSACDDSTKRSLGLSRTSPDEFAVLKRAPLSQPPDYNLRPPRPGAERPGVASPREQARQSVFRGDATEERSPTSRNDGPAVQAAPQGEVNRLSAGESAFLSRAGADNIEPNIRSKVDREYAVLREADSNFVQRLLDYQADIDDVLDAPAEARRLRENQALGRPKSLRAPAIFANQKTIVDAPTLITARQPPEHSSEALRQGGDRQCIFQFWRHIADAALNRWIPVRRS